MRSPSHRARRHGGWRRPTLLVVGGPLPAQNWGHSKPPLGAWAPLALEPRAASDPYPTQNPCTAKRLAHPHQPKTSRRPSNQPSVWPPPPNEAHCQAIQCWRVAQMKSEQTPANEHRVDSGCFHGTAAWRAPAPHPEHAEPPDDLLGGGWPPRPWRCPKRRHQSR